MKAEAIANSIRTRPARPSIFALISEFRCGYQQARMAVEMAFGAETPPIMYYQPLFDLLSREHGLTLLESEMHEIELVCQSLGRKLSPAYPSAPEPHDAACLGCPDCQPINEDIPPE
jgi:hypothetical protein